MSLLLDLAVVAVLALCAWRGAVRGLVLTLCGLLAVLVAFGGAFFLSDRFSDGLASLIQPYIQVHVEDLLETSAEEDTDDAAPPSSGLSIPGYSEDEETIASLDEVLRALSGSKLFAGLAQSVADAIDEGVLAVVTTAAAAVSAFLAQQIARSGLFLVSFFLILVVWWLLSHVLDLAFRLPVLRTLNKSGGLLIGLAKGVLVLLVACWALTVFDLVSPAAAQQTFLFRHFMNFQIP